MSIDTAIHHFRRRELQLMDLAGCTVTVTRGGSAGTFNPATLAYDIPADADTIYEGPANIRPVGAGGVSETEAASQQITVGRWVVKIPDLDTVFQLGDLCAVTTSVQEPALAGQVLEVKEIPTDDWAVVRRLVCEEDR